MYILVSKNKINERYKYCYKQNVFNYNFGQCICGCTVLIRLPHFIKQFNKLPLHFNRSINRAFNLEMF